MTLSRVPHLTVGQDELLLKSRYPKFPTDWTLDGRFIVYYENNPKTKRDIWVLPLSGTKTPSQFLHTEANEVGGRLSPVGRWMAYASDESGEYEVYVQSYLPLVAKSGSRPKVELVRTGGGMGRSCFTTRRTGS